MIKKLSFLLICVLYFLPVNSQTYEWTAREKLCLEEINKIRTNPQAYIPVIKAYVDSVLSVFDGVRGGNSGMESLYECAFELIQILKIQEPLPELKPKVCLLIAARKHGQWLLDNDLSQHRGLNGSSPGQRMRLECGESSDWSSGENLWVCTEEPKIVALGWLIDWGYPGRGHRKALLASRYTVVGIGEAKGEWENAWVMDASNK